MKNIIGDNIKSYRESLDLTQGKLAKVIKVSRGQICYYESGSRIPSLKDLHKLSNLFGVEVFELNQKDSLSRNLNSVIAFKKNSLTKTDLSAISDFRKIAKNYLNLLKL